MKISQSFRFAVLSAFLLAPSLWAAPKRDASSSGAGGSLPDLIDVPTADSVDHYGYIVGFRFYAQGGILTKTTFGVFPRLNVGFGLDTERFVGTQTVDVNRPTLNVKLRFFDGERNFPALALGYDGQGYFFNHVIDKYSQRERGLYLVGSSEVFVPDLHMHGGLNVYDFSEDKVFMFAGVNYTYQDTLALLFEVDNVRTSRENRLNLGLRYFITPSLSVDVAGRNMWAAGLDAERIVRLNYSGSF